MLTSGAFEVSVASEDVRWFAKNRDYPVVVRLDGRQDTARIGETVFRLFRAEGGGYHVGRRESGSLSALGTVDQHGIRRSTSSDARKDLRAIRAAVFDVEYAAIIAHRIDNGAMKRYAHPHCFARYKLRKGERTKPLTALKCAKRCTVCKEGIE